MRYSPCPELKDKDWLYQQYVCNGRTMKYIADELKVSSSRVFSWLNKHNIKTRTQSTYLKGKKFSEENKPNWKDFIFNRDIFCVNCGSTNQRVAHHIKSYQEYQELRFDVWNGVILCRSCHSAYHACLSVNGFNSKN